MVYFSGLQQFVGLDFPKPKVGEVLEPALKRINLVVMLLCFILISVLLPTILSLIYVGEVILIC